MLGVGKGLRPGHLLTAWRGGVGRGAGVLRPGPGGLRTVSRPPVAGAPQTTKAHTAKAKSGRKVLESLLVVMVGPGQQPLALDNLRELAVYLLHVVARQFEVHTSQKLRRGLQLYSVYSRMWGEEAAQTLLRNLRRMVMSRGKILLSAVCFANFDWDKEKIPDEDLHRSVDDLDSVEDLCRATVVCEDCGKRQVIDQQMANIEYCRCGGAVGYTDGSRVYDCWQPFIEREHHVVWRRRHPVHHHLFAYKVYGTYDDVSLSAFMEVQLNSRYRTDWDDTALALNVLESDEGSNSDLVYWLVKFPHFFANRDYIFKRRFAVNIGSREVVIMSEAVTPNLVPEEKGVHRVNEYWSTMVIRARHDINQPGIEYTLTYFDNPGTSLPQSVTNFIAATGFPNFLKKLHGAAMSLQAVYEEGKDVFVSLPRELRFPRLGRSFAGPTPPTILPGEQVVSSAAREELGQAGDTQTVCSGVELQGSSNLTEEIVSASQSNVIIPDDLEVVHDNSKVFSIDEQHKQLEDKHAIIAPGDTVEGDAASCTSEEPPTRDQGDGASVEPAAGKTCSDTALRVNVRGKSIAVDMLEAMEVVAPDLEEKSILLKKIESLIADSEYRNGSSDKSIVVEKLRKLKSRLLKYHEHVTQKKESSLRKMEELQSKGHYDHSGVDEKTRKQVEALFEAIRGVMEADRNMRTGKDLIEKSEVVAAGDEQVLPDSSTAGEKCLTKMPEIVDGEEVRKKKPGLKSAKEDGSGPQPPEDPPPSISADAPPDQPFERSDGGDSGFVDGEAFKDGGEIGVGDPSDKSSNLWSFLPNLSNVSAWWDSTGQQETCPHPDVSAATAELGNTEKNSTKEETACDAQDSSYSLLAQVWYVVGLRWVVGSLQGQEERLSCSSEECKLEETAEKKESVPGGGGEVRWYWYPFSGVYRACVWAFTSHGSAQ